METLTIKEALEQGYTRCTQPQGEFEILSNIQDLGDMDFDDTDWIIAEKEGSSPYTNAKDLQGLIAETLDSNHGDNTGDDRELVYNAIMKIDFTDIANKINVKMGKIKTYGLTEIKLTP